MTASVAFKNGTTPHGMLDMLASTPPSIVGASLTVPLGKIPYGWTIDSWKTKKIQQEIVYENAEELQKVCEHLQQLPALVCSAEVESAREDFKAVAEGRQIIIQGGDCAESFGDSTDAIIQEKLELLLLQGQYLSDQINVPAVKVGRIAGQYAKPRSSPFEVVGGETVHSFKGCNVNEIEASVESRTPDPQRLLIGYLYAALTMNSIRRYVAKIRKPQEAATKPLVYVSHEALVLPLEAALTRRIVVDDKTAWYNLSAHFVWVGERTRDLDGAHLEYLRGIRNPIGVKISSSFPPDDMQSLLDKIDPDHQAGRVVLIFRLGADKVEGSLPALLEAVKKSGHLPVIMFDPCHANTVSADGGRKTRYLSAIEKEMCAAIRICARHRVWCGGLHFEQSPEPVTECKSGDLIEGTDDITQNYTTLCDPRLSRRQALHAIVSAVDALAREGRKV